MFKRLLSSIGVGGATVDTRLHADSFVPGGTVSGETHIVGGSDAQEFNRIYLAVSTRYKHDDSTHEHTLVEHEVAGKMEIGAGEERAVPFSFRLPYETPLSVGHQDVTVHTGLDVPGAIDPGDADPIQVSPHPLEQAVLSAAQNLGFTLRQAENEYAPRKGAPLPFVQQLEFRPGGRYAGRVEELELVFKLAGDDALEVLVELDRRAGGLGGLLESALEMNERVSRLTVTRSDVERGAVEDMLARLIDSHIR
ncbi:MAG: sporulation protein [Rubrobacter sp.]